LTAKVFGLALAAVQIAPTIESLADSVRVASATVDPSFSESGSLHPLNIVQLVAPYLFTTRVVGQNTHELSLYVGIVPFLLSIVALASRGCEQKHFVTPLRRLAILLVASGALLALGKHGPMHSLLAGVPFFGYFRFPSRAIVLVELGIALLAAIGFARMFRAAGGEQNLDLPRKTCWLVAVAGLAAAVAGTALWPQYTTADGRLWFGPVVLVIAIVSLSFAARGSRWALHAIVVLAAADLGAYGLSYAVYRDNYSLSGYIDSTPTPPIQPGRRVALDLARPDDEGPRVGNQILLRGLSRIDGYAGLIPARELDYRQPAALRAAGVGAVPIGAPIAESKHLQSAGDGWLYVGKPLPRARLARSYRASDEPAAEIPRVDLEREVVIQPADSALVEAHLGNASEPQSADYVKLASDRPGCIAVEVSASRPAILVLNESYHGGWKAVVRQSTSAQGRRPPVEDRAVRTLRVNGDFLACLAPEGRFTVEFRFAPQSLRYGRLISVCSLGLLVILAAAATRQWAVCALRPACVPRFRAFRGD
jgi:hypothetical protein